MDFAPSALGLTLTLLALVLVGVEVGRFLGRRLRTSEHQTGPIDAAVFALLGLLLAFTFSGAASRFEHRRALIVEEANAAGTLWLRLDLLPADSSADARRALIDYVESRLRYEQGASQSLRRTLLPEAEKAQARLWSSLIAACNALPNPAFAGLIIQPANEMFDIASRRLAARQTHIHPLIVILLLVLAGAAAALAGSHLAHTPRRHWLHPAILALTIAASFYVIIDLEYPRLGLIRLSGFDQFLTDLIAQMKSHGQAGAPLPPPTPLPTPPSP